MSAADRPEDASPTSAQFERLLDVGRSLVSELDVETVLSRVLEAARDLTGARYAALGILDVRKQELERFLHVGIDEQTRDAIGPLPRGRGVLGELIRRPEPLRLADVGEHPHSYGFPANHPEMRSFLGTPVLIRGEAWGNLYLTEKTGGEEFTEADERVVVVLAAWTAVAIENARLYQGLDERRAELERIHAGLEVSADVSRAAASGIEVDELLELIAKRARSLVGAEAAAVVLADEEGLEVAAAAGELAERFRGIRGLAEEDLIDALGLEPPREGSTTLASPLRFRAGRPGLLLASGSLAADGFHAGERSTFESFAISAATTIASVRSAEAEKVRLSIRASEGERKRWARELHDETLQELGALRFLLEAAARGDHERILETCRRALDHVDKGIADLQALITELRPASLDALGVGPAIEALVRDSSARSGVKVEAELALGSERLDRELEATVYRLIQEAVNNALKHADATRVGIRAAIEGESVAVTVTDDGTGFAPESATGRFGLVGMRERVALAGGRLSIESEPGAGTTVSAELPLEPASAREGQRPSQASPG